MSAQTVSFQINSKERRKGDARAAVASVYSSSTAASEAVARRIAEVIRSKAAAGEQAVLGLATGSTPTGVYDALVRMHRDERLSFRNVVTFNLDEYWPMKPAALQSYRRFMDEHLFDHVDIDRSNTHIPDGDAPQADVAACCENYERLIQSVGGIDLQLLGIGRTGHIGFNEPGSSRESRTRLITLDKVTRMDAASDFFGEWNVPRRAITMGVGTILEAKRIILMAFGESKAKVIRQAIEGEITSAVAASFLQRHGDAEFVLDAAAASELTKVKTPWLVGPLAAQGLTWDATLTRRAVIWLAGVVNKPILKLVGEDYNEHGLQELLSERGTAYDVNIEVFRSMQTTITGWPGGKPERVVSASSIRAATARDRGAQAPDASISVRDSANQTQSASAATANADPFPKRIIVFSPHPDDDVISMGGTLIRLCEQGHEVHVAYQTSGNIAVFDEEAIRHAEFVTEFCRAFELISQKEAQRIDDAIRGSTLRKVPGMVDAPELQRIKGLIRRTEARAAARFCGVAAERIHFLDLPFYETGRVRKRPLSDADIRIVTRLLETVRPHQVYAAGDLSDPHGTHRVCLAAVTAAFERLSATIGTPHGSGGPSASVGSIAGTVSNAGAQPAAWIGDCALWLYRGAWQEWEPDRIEMAVPLSPDEVERKRLAIFKHQSQKDRALFPGPSDPREFWQRAEDRNRATAELYDRLGLPEYQALEAFVRWRAGMV